MPEEPHVYLEEFGLSAAEVEAYMALIRNGPLGASAIASVTRLRRSNVYHALDSLAEKGLVEGATGYGSRFSVVPAKQALPSLIAREKQALAERERLAAKIVDQLSTLEEPGDTSPGEVVQIIRSPRSVAERFDRLQLEAEREILMIVKGPFLNPRKGNPTQQKILRRGVRVRSLYEREVLDDPEIAPYLEGWIAAGEEARVYDGKLPHKLVVFDQQVVLAPLVTGDQTKTLLIRHAQLAESLSLGFQFLWERSQPLRVTSRKKPRPPNGSRSGAKNGDAPSSSRNDRQNHKSPAA